MMRRLLQVVRAASVALVLLLVVGWSTHGSWAPGMLVLALSPDGVPAQRPDGVRATIDVARAGARVRAWVFDPARAPRGTVVLLHGIRDDKRRLEGSARLHAARGLRAVVVDSRGHGESSGRYLTYGVEEARDLRAVIDELDRRALLTRPLAVVGTSYGGATALLHAAIDSRVERVVALAPFASLREVVRSHLQWILGPLSHAVPASITDRLVDDSARRAGFDPDRACPRCLAPRVRAATLLVHGKADERIPWQHSAAIHEALGSLEKRLLLVDGVGHAAIGRGPGVDSAVHAWLDARR